VASSFQPVAWSAPQSGQARALSGTAAPHTGQISGGGLKSFCIISSGPFTTQMDGSIMIPSQYTRPEKIVVAIDKTPKTE
jgi:hypothetical protein